MTNIYGDQCPINERKKLQFSVQNCYFWQNLLFFGAYQENRITFEVIQDVFWPDCLKERFRKLLLVLQIGTIPWERHFPESPNLVTSMLVTDDEEGFSRHQHQGLGINIKYQSPTSHSDIFRL